MAFGNNDDPGGSQSFPDMLWKAFEDENKVQEWADEKEALDEYEKTSEIPYAFDGEIDLHGFPNQGEAMSYFEAQVARLRLVGCKTVRVITGAGHGSTSRALGSQRRAAARFAENTLIPAGLVSWVDDSCQYRGTTGAIVIGIA